MEEGLERRGGREGEVMEGRNEGGGDGGNGR